MDKNQENSKKMDDIFNEVEKFLKEKEKYIKESIIGSRIINELTDFTLEVGLKKTYLCVNRDQENVFPVLTKVTENFIQAYGGTAIIYPKGDNICLELITPKRGV
ncbi:hypothetical protein [Methanobacterium alcaliphilum]|uniref:hypothetical protein n=1 Tax=Methanobacterium alcaliphilum TaxID=392018 RepID=UPI00200B6DE0|nr:hypothetical protein [Methanobacterium alcaliphilum]MCK9150597.1 hypothetical protein [Methanobacterium alcaliphilum]